MGFIRPSCSGINKNIYGVSKQYHAWQQGRYIKPFNFANAKSGTTAYKQE